MKEDDVGVLIRGKWGDTEGVEDRLLSLERARIQSDPQLTGDQSAPPEPRIFRHSPADSDVFEMAWRPVDDARVAGYNVYRGYAATERGVAERVTYIAQVPNKEDLITFKDPRPDAYALFYWVATVNKEGIESPRVRATRVMDPAAPGPVQNFVVTGANGIFTAVWDDPLTNINTLDEFVIAYATLADFSDQTIVRLGRRNEVSGEAFNKVYYWRIAAHNLSGDLTTNADADLNAYRSGGWGPWTNAPGNPVAAGNPYGMGTDTAAPSSLSAAASANGMKLLFGVTAGAQNNSLHQAEIRISYTDDVTVTTMDLTSPDIQRESVPCTPWGAQFELTAEKPGRYFYTWRVRNRFNDGTWSAWTDGGLAAVTSYVDTNDNFDSGVPTGWTVNLEDNADDAKISAGKVRVKVTRPTGNGNNLLRWVWQIRDTTSGSWVGIGQNTSPNDRYYDGSAIAHETIDGGFKIKRTSGAGFGTASAGDLVLLDVRGGSFHPGYCQWGTVVEFQDADGDPEPVGTAVQFVVQGRFRPQATSDLRIKIMKPPWEWETGGYFGPAGIGGEWIQDRGDSVFYSPPIDLGDASLSNLDAKVWFFNHYGGAASSTEGGADTVSTDLASTAASGPTGGDSGIPTLNTPAAVANGMELLIGVTAASNGNSVFEGKLKIARLPDGQAYQATYDVENASDMQEHTFAASQDGGNITLTVTKPGRYFYALALQNHHGWSNWTSGQAYATGPTSVAWAQSVSTTELADDGPPEGWSVEIRRSPIEGFLVVRATRPTTNGNNLIRWVVQIKDSSQGSWVTLGSGSSPDVVKYDGSASANRVRCNDNGNRLVRQSGAGFGSAAVGDLVLLDVRGGAWSRNYCQWGTIRAIHGAGAYIDIEGHFRPRVFDDLRYKIVTPPWDWTAGGYLGNQENQGIVGQWIQGAQQDEFISPFIEIEDTAQSFDARVWFENTYSISDASNKDSASATVSTEGVPSQEPNSHQVMRAQHGTFFEGFEITPDDWIAVESGDSITIQTSGEAGGRAIRCAGGNAWRVWDKLIPFDPSKLYRIRCRVRWVGTPGDTSKMIFYCGVNAWAADGTTKVDRDGDNNYSHQHYICCCAKDIWALQSVNVWHEYTGWFKGTAATGEGLAHPDPTDPAALHEDTRYFSPLFICNYNGGPGDNETELDYIAIDIVDEELANRGYNAILASTLINNNKVVTASMQDLAVQLAKIDSNAVSEPKIQTSAVTAGKIAALNVQTGHLEALAVTTAKIAAGAVTANEINVGTLSAISADIGSITSGTITGAVIRTTSGNNRIEMNYSGSQSELKAVDSGGNVFWRVKPGVIGTNMEVANVRLADDFASGATMIIAGFTDKNSNLLIYTADGTQLSNRSLISLTHNQGISMAVSNLQKLDLRSSYLDLQNSVELRVGGNTIVTNAGVVQCPVDTYTNSDLFKLTRKAGGAGTYPAMVAGEFVFFDDGSSRRELWYCDGNNRWYWTGNFRTGTSD
jgi:hypothetical protein